jgi:hypothetical protein
MEFTENHRVPLKQQEQDACVSREAPDLLSPWRSVVLSRPPC